MHAQQEMERLQMMIEEDLDAVLERLAVEHGTSKADLIRKSVRESYDPRPAPWRNPLLAMPGVDKVILLALVIYHTWTWRDDEPGTGERKRATQAGSSCPAGVLIGWDRARY